MQFFKVCYRVLKCNKGLNCIFVRLFESALRKQLALSKDHQNNFNFAEPFAH